MGVLQFVATVISSLAWPAVLIIFILVFRKQIKAVFQKLADRLKKISGGGFEAEFAEAKLEWGTAVVATSPGTIIIEPAHDSPVIGEAFSEDEEGGDLFSDLPEVDLGTRTRITGGDGTRGTESDKPPHVQLDPQVRVHLVKAKNVVKSRPREAVLNAGIALERSITTTLDLLGIPDGVDANGRRTYVPPISALRHAGVVDGIQAASLDRLNTLYRSAAQDSANDPPFQRLNTSCLFREKLKC